jgi:hypothetical protein
MNKKHIIITAIVLLISMGLATPVFAAQVNIFPPYPTKSSTGIFTANANKETTNVYVLLVMTKTSYDALTGTVNVAWTNENGGTAGNKDATTWYGPINDGSVKLPESSKIAPLYFGSGTGGGYTTSSCRDHLGVSNTEALYYAWIPTTMILSNTLVTITITLPSGSPNMLVYLAGQTSSASTNEINTRIPPTNGGLFVVPEYTYGALAAIGACFAALAVIKRKK